jgi:hypothetical protein
MTTIFGVFPGTGDPPISLLTGHTSQHISPPIRNLAGFIHGVNQFASICG